MLHLPDLGLAVQRDIHRHTRLLHVGVQPFERDENRGDLDLVGHHRRDVRRPAHQFRHFGLDIRFLEEPAFERDEIGQRRADRKDAHRDLVLFFVLGDRRVRRGRAQGERRHRADRQLQEFHGALLPIILLAPPSPMRPAARPL